MQILAMIDFQDPKHPEAIPDYLLTVRQGIFTELLAQNLATEFQKRGVKKVKIISSTYVSCMQASGMLDFELKQKGIMTIDEEGFELQDDELVTPIDTKIIRKINSVVERHFYNVEAVVIVPSQRLVPIYLKEVFKPGMLAMVYEPTELGVATIRDIEKHDCTILHWAPDELVSSGRSIGTWFSEKIGRTNGDYWANNAQRNFCGSVCLLKKARYLKEIGSQKRMEIFTKETDGLKNEPLYVPQAELELG